MGRKARDNSPAKKPTRKRPDRAPKPEELYPSLAQGPAPTERLARFLKEGEARGIKPLDEAALEEMGKAWPEDEDLDEFLSWLYQARRSGRYS